MANSALVESKLSQSQDRLVNFNQRGHHNTQIANVENYNQINNFVGSTCSQGVYSPSSINCDYYNLFVIGDEQFDGSFFIVPKDRALTECTDDYLKERYSSLSAESINSIKSFPSVFCSLNHNFSETDDAHYAYFGFVIEVKVTDVGIKVYFVKRSCLPQNLLIRMSEQLRIKRAELNSELNRTHWAIKPVNVVDTLKAVGRDVFEPSF